MPEEPTLDIAFYLSLITSAAVLLSPFLLQKKGVIKASNIVVSFGILGTFGGIVLGLIQFDVSQINTSIPKLLEGMRFAFLTSLSGIGASIILKVKPTLYGFKELPDTTIDIFYSGIKSVSVALDRLQQSISGDSDSTVVTQLRLLNSDQNRLLREQTLAILEFGEKLVANSTEPLIEAIETVFEDFNTKVNNHLGNSIAEFSEAVDSMRSWQFENAQQIEQLSSSLEQIFAGIEILPNQLNQIQSQLERITGTTKGLNNVISMLGNSISHTESLVQQLENVIPNVSKSINEMMQECQSLIESSKNDLSIARSGLEQQRSVMIRSFEEINTKLYEAFEILNAHLEEISNKNATRITEQIGKLDEQLGEELKRSLESLGNQLASLSAQFVNDYTPLTRKLREIVELAKNVNQ